MTCVCGWPMTPGEIHWRNGEQHEAVERRPSPIHDPSQGGTE